MTVSLKISGQNTRSIFIDLSKKPITLGRSDKCSQAISDPKCSSTHCEIRINENGMTVIKDLGSKNGTILNGTPIKEISFYLGDQFLIGDTKLSLESAKMTPDEIKLHTSSAPKRRSTVIEIPVLELEEPVRKVTASTRPAAEDDEEELGEEERTLTNILKKIVGKIKS